MFFIDIPIQTSHNFPVLALEIIKFIITSRIISIFILYKITYCLQILYPSSRNMILIIPISTFLLTGSPQNTRTIAIFQFSIYKKEQFIFYYRSSQSKSIQTRSITFHIRNVNIVNRFSYKVLWFLICIDCSFQFIGTTLGYSINRSSRKIRIRNTIRRNIDANFINCIK